MTCENCSCCEELDEVLKGLCIEKDGKCYLGENCRCLNQEDAEEGW